MSSYGNNKYHCESELQIKIAANRSLKEKITETFAYKPWTYTTLEGLIYGGDYKAVLI